MPDEPVKQAGGLLGPGTTAFAADGVVSAGEYSVDVSGGPVRVRLALDQNFLYGAAEAATAGWVALGLNSLVMDGATLILGKVDQGTPDYILVQGSGHTHPETGTGLTSWKVTEAGGTTLMEFSLPKSQVTIAGGSLKVLAAYSSGDSFSQKHSQRDFFSVKVAE